MSNNYTLSRAEHTLVNREDLQACVALLSLSCALSREHSRLVAKAQQLYGSHGADVSAVGRDHFPESVKMMLREISYAIGHAVDRAHEMKPAGVHTATLRALGRTIAKRDGTGFYGVQS